jgi:hypothetical protein
MVGRGRNRELLLGTVLVLQDEKIILEIGAQQCEFI